MISRIAHRRALHDREGGASTTIVEPIGLFLSLFKIAGSLIRAIGLAQSSCVVRRRRKQYVLGRELWWPIILQHSVVAKLE